MTIINVDARLDTGYISESQMDNEKRIANVAVKLYPSLKKELEEIARKEVRTLSQVTFLLIERGLQAYKSDGKLRDEHSKIHDRDNTTDSAQTSRKREASRSAHSK